MIEGLLGTILFIAQVIMYYKITGGFYIIENVPRLLCCVSFCMIVCIFIESIFDDKAHPVELTATGKILTSAYNIFVKLPLLLGMAYLSWRTCYMSYMRDPHETAMFIASFSPYIIMLALSPVFGAHQK